MAWGLFAYESQTAGINAALTQLNAIADQSLQPVNNAIVIPGSIGNQASLNKLGGLLAGGATLTAAQLQSPSLRQLFFPDIRPIDVGAAPTSPPKWLDLSNDLIQLQIAEQLQAFITNTASDVEYLLIQLTDGAYGAVGGEIQTVKATATTTLVAGAWTNTIITFSQNLPAGRYQVVGMRAESATGIAARVVFPGGYWRPGCPCSVAKTGLDFPKFRMGGYGVWGEFTLQQLPSVDVLASAADTAETFWFDLIQVSSAV